MTDLREAAQMALDALETITSKVAPMSYYCSFAVEIESLRAALAQPEPVLVSPKEFISAVTGKWDISGIPMLMSVWPVSEEFTEPPQREWVGLTDEEIEDACWTEVDQRLRSFTRAIEAKLKEKNT